MPAGGALARGFLLNIKGTVRVGKRPRDVFPYARPGPLSRGCRQRSERRIHFEEEVCHTTDALNHMYKGT